MDGPLSSLKLLDFTPLLPGPFATMILADLGAEVLRLEAPHRPDAMRLTPPFDGKVSVGHALVNRSKRSIAIDLKHPEGGAIVRRLLQSYDIVIEAFRPGVMDRLGVGYEALSRINPALIYCSITGYGQTGPYRDRAGHDINYLALAGIMSHTGRKESGPLPLGIQVADVAGGSFGAVAAILAAVIHRTQTGKGQHVDISMFDMSLAQNALAAGHYLVSGRHSGYEDNWLNGGGFYDVYRTRDGRYLSVGCLEPKFWKGFCEAIGHPELIETGYELVQSGYAPIPEHVRRAKETIRSAMVQRTMEEWCDLFGTMDVCVEPVLNMEEVTGHPQTLARNMVVEVPRPEGGTQKQIGSPFKFSEAKPTYRHMGVELGADTDAVLAEAGYTNQEIEVLRASGVFG